MRTLKPIPTLEELAHIEQIRSIERAELESLIRASTESAQAMRDAMKFAAEFKPVQEDRDGE